MWVYEAGLPAPYVYYSPEGFIQFAETPDQQPAFCTCMEEGIDHYMALRHQVLPFEGGSADDNRLFDPYFFPEPFRSQDQAEKALVYKEKCCHACLKVKPTRAFCTKREGTRFKQEWGWYINQHYFAMGVVPHSFRYLPGQGHPDVLEWIAVSYASLTKEIQESEGCSGLFTEDIQAWLEDHDRQWTPGTPRIWDPQYPVNFIDEMRTTLNKHHADGHKAIENAIRKRLGVRAIGDRWVEETTLYHLLQEAYPDLEMSRHYRPKWLEGLELDIFIHGVNIGIEYQGIQHYKPLKHWGGNKGLAKVQARDKKKKKLCKALDIPMVEFLYDDKLTADLVLERMAPYMDVS